MLRLCSRSRRKFHYTFLLRSFSSSNPKSPIEVQPPKTSQQISLSPHLNSLSPSPPPSSLSQTPNGDSSSFTRSSLLALSATALLAAILASTSFESGSDRSPNPLYDVVDTTMQKSNESLSRFYRHLKQTGVAASVLWQSLRSVMSSANHEVWAGFELRVAALLADIAAANASRRAAIVSAGGGKVVDWLLETVAVGGDSCGTQAESARALSYLIEDPNVCEAILGRPRAVPNLLRFIFSCQPQRKKKKHSRRSSFDVSDSLKGRSMLVAAIMDIVTSNCDGFDKIAFKPTLSGNAEMRDIAAAIQVIEEGGLHLDDSNGNEEEDSGDKGVKGIGIKILEGTTVLGLARTNGPVDIKLADASHPRHANSVSPDILLENKYVDSLPQANISSTIVPGLWDDLHCEHVAVPFAAWALANWAMASEENRSHIQELDRDGHAIMAALLAPERSVKWHGSLVARLLLEDRNLPINDSVPDWTSSLLSTLSQASKNEDIPLAQVALSAFLVSVERSLGAQKIVMEKGLHLLRDTAKRTTKHKQVQEVLSKAMELICTGDMRLSLEESQIWSGVLLQWVSGSYSSDTVRSSATKILSCILEDYGPFAVPISQGWLAILLSEILSSGKASLIKGNVQPKSDKVKTQIDQSNVLSAGQNTNQLAVAVVGLAGNQLGNTTESVDTFPLADLLSLEPFVGALKNIKKDSLQKINAADSAVATLKGIKSLAELCVEDWRSQKKIVDFGVLCLLKRFLLCDDYEKLAAMEVYDASRSPEAQDKTSGPSESSRAENTDPSGIRLPPTAHIRKHAARLLNILSLLPEVQKAIVEDEVWYKWLGDCANGKIPGCNDPKMQSYARSTLLNVFCNDQIYQDTNSGDANGKRRCPRYLDNVFLINPEAPHWKCPEVTDQDNKPKDGSTSARTNSFDSVANPFFGNDPMVNHGSSKDEQSSSVDVSHGDSKTGNPLLDVVFVHGLRGGPYKSWRISEDKTSTKSGFVEKIDEEAGKQGTFWPAEWLPSDFPQARLFTLKYKTNLTQWSGATLPLQEVSSMLLQKLVDAGIGNRPVVFVTHSMGGLVVKQLLYRAQLENIDNLVKNTVGIVFYSCPHFGSKLADMPWRMGLVLRPAPTIGELRSGSPRLVELNDFIRHLHKKGSLEVLSFCETKVTPIVEGYGGWALRMEIVPLESAYPGFGELVVLESTDHINSCKPISRTDPSYTETLDLLHKLMAQYS